jgi:hypothetical protein
MALTFIGGRRYKASQSHKDRQEALLPEYVTYQVIERALASMYGANDAVQRGALRGRLDNLKRAKALGVNPGKGQRVVYDREAMIWLLIALELEEFGIAPTVIGALFAENRGKLGKFVDKAARAEDFVLTVQPAFLSASWRGRKGKDALPEIGEIPGRKAMDGFYGWLRGDRSTGGVTGSSPRACVFNLSARLRALDKALAKATEPPRPQPTGLAKKIIDAGRKARGEK